MRCMMCENFSYTHICKKCQQNFLQPSLYKRTLKNGVDLFSFYKYDEIKQLLHTKHTDLGYHIYTILAKLSFKKFAQEFHTKEKLVSLCIDDHVKSGYSHTAILNKHLKSYNIYPLFNKIRAQNKVSYSGKSRIFRKINKRDFKINFFKQTELILIDDIVTTGETLTQAIEALGKEKKVLFCLTLCDLSQKNN